MISNLRESDLVNRLAGSEQNARGSRNSLKLDEGAQKRNCRVWISSRRSATLFLTNWPSHAA